MGKKPIDYSKTLIYKIVCKNTAVIDLYVGSTTNFTKRKCSHKEACTNANSKKHNFNVYQFIRDNGNWDNWDMILIEYYPCNTELEKLQRERYWIEELKATLNTVKNIGLLMELGKGEYIKQHRLKNKESVSQYYKQYHKDNKETKINIAKQHYEKNKEKIKLKMRQVCECECGCTYTLANKLRHERSTIHQEYLINRKWHDIDRGLQMIKLLDKHFNKFI